MTAAAKQGFDLVSRVGNLIVVSIFGKEYRYEVLNNIEFNSYRKRYVQERGERRRGVAGEQATKASEI